MHPHLKSLIELQAVDFRLIGIRERLASFQSAWRKWKRASPPRGSKSPRPRNRCSPARKSARRTRWTSSSGKSARRNTGTRAREVKTNEAYKALLHEIQNAEDEVAKAEDRLLERMVSGEEYDRQVKAAEAAVKEIEAAANKERQAIQAEYNATQKELAAAEAVRAAAVAAVPEDLVDHYERIAKRHGGIALAEIRGEGCGQCGVHIRPHVIQQLQRDSNEGFFHCETCTRILYYADHSAAPGPPATSASAVASAGDPPATPAREN